MPTKRKSPAGMRAPPMVIESRFEACLFLTSDIPNLAAAAGLPIPSADHRTLVSDLHRAFAKAHQEACLVRNRTPTAELRDGYAGAAAAGRALLLALGIVEEDPEKLSYSNTLNRSALLRALVQRAPPDTRDLLPREIVERFAPQYPISAKRRRELAWQRQIVESARAVAFLVATAEAACKALPKPKKHGPPPDAFAPVLLDELVKCYRQMFECWPVVQRAEGEIRGGAALHWLHRVLLLAHDRFQSSGYDCISSAGSEPDDLFTGIKRLLDNEPETRGSNFEKAIARVKRGDRSFR